MTKNEKEFEYGIVWEVHPEMGAKILKENTNSVLVEDSDLTIENNPHNLAHHTIIEGENLIALKLLLKDHHNKIDFITIDPPYNHRKNDLKYDDDFYDTSDIYSHSKWLDFMSIRLKLAKELLSEDGVIIINIDEHEVHQLACLLAKTFGEENCLGEIIWNKQNPKGDSKGIAYMHETILCYCKNKKEFLKNKQVCMRKKPNAEKIIKKAEQLFRKLGKKEIPYDVKQIMKQYYKDTFDKKDLYVTYDLELINKEFQAWLNKQPFSNGEKAYKYIDENGRVYRGVSMAWPNKKTPSDEYFIPLIHPITKKSCPVPARGWRNPPETMHRLLNDGLIIFGQDERKQPERKYYLDENLYENLPSIYNNGDSADKALKQIGLEFEYAKPLSEAIYLCACIKPGAKIFLDFFAGSGTTGEAILELNKLDGGNRTFILCNNNDNNICRNTTYKRIKTAIDKYDNEEAKPNLKYYKIVNMQDTQSRKEL